MSNTLLNLVFAEKTLKGVRRTMMLAIAHSIDENRIYGEYGIEQLAQATNITPRHARRVRQDLEDDGFIYVKPGNGRGHQTKYLITFHLSEGEIADGLTHYLEMSPPEAEGAAKTVIEKRGTFSNKGGHFRKKEDVKGDILERKGDTTERETSNPIESGISLGTNPKTNTSGAKAPESPKPKSPPLDESEAPAIQIPKLKPRKWDPLIDALLDRVFQATSILDRWTMAPRAAVLIHGDKRRPQQIALAKYEMERQGLAELDAERIQHLARDVPLMVADYQANNDSDLPLDLTRFMTHWVKFRGRQNGQISSAASQRRTSKLLAKGPGSRVPEGAIEKAKL